MRDVDVFRRMTDDRLFKEWLDHQRDTAIKGLAGSEGAQLHRWQGRFALIEEMLGIIDAAKNLR